MPRSVAEGEPFAVGGNVAVKQPHAEVGQVQLGAAIMTDGELAEVDDTRLGLEFRRLQGLCGELGKELIKTAINIGKRGGLLGGHREIDAPQSAEERTEETFLQEINGSGPVGLASGCQLVEVSASSPIGEHKLIGKRRRASVDRSAGPSRKSSPVVITV